VRIRRNGLFWDYLDFYGRFVNKKAKKSRLIYEDISFSFNNIINSYTQTEQMWKTIDDKQTLSIAIVEGSVIKLMGSEAKASSGD